MHENPAPNLLQEIESRQNEVLRMLDDLESRLHATLKGLQIQVAPSTIAIDQDSKAA